MERSLTDSENDYQFFPFSAHCCIVFQLPLNFDHQPKTVAATKVYHMIVTMNICMNRMVSDWREIQGNVIEGCVIPPGGCGGWSDHVTSFCGLRMVLWS